MMLYNMAMLYLGVKNNTEKIEKYNSRMIFNKLMDFTFLCEKMC